MDEKPIDSASMCRACMNTTGQVVSMYDVKISSEAMLSDKFINTTGVEIDEHDGLPTVLCTKCAYRVNTFYNFKLKVQESENLLQKIFKRPIDTFLNKLDSADISEKSQYEPNCCDFHYVGEEYLEADLSSVLIKDDYSNNVGESISINIEKLESEKNNQPSSSPAMIAVEEQEWSVNEDQPMDLTELEQGNETNFDSSDWEDDADQNENLLGSIKDTIVKIKETKLPDGAMQFHCTLCMEAYKDLQSILTHTVDYHVPNDGPFYCMVCEKDCDSHRALRYHVKIHTGPNPYKCFICLKSYSTKRYLKRHMICHADFPRYRCTKCGKRFQTKHDLDGHTETHGNIKSFVCNQCPRSFNYKATYKRHLISHLDPKGLRLQKYLCDYCGKNFRNNRTLQTHRRVHTGEKPYKCAICSRCFSQQGNLVNHERLHLNPRSYTCEICGKRFNQRATLRDHTLLHTGEKPYVCSVCGLAFTFSTSLRRHEWSHATDKPYGCDVCNARFVGRYELKRHQKIHLNLRSKNSELTGDLKQSQISGAMPSASTIFIPNVFNDENETEMIVGNQVSEENVDCLLNLIQFDG